MVYFYFSSSLNNKNKTEEWDNNFLLPYSYHYKNYYESDNPNDWIKFQPHYIKRYINIYENDEVYIFNLSREEKVDALGSICFDSQREADLWIKLNQQFKDKPIIHDDDHEIVYINVYERGNELIEIEISEVAANDCFEQIKCIDVEEALDLLDEMVHYYEEYREVQVGNLL